MIRRILKKLDNRYAWAALAFLVWIIFFDRYNLFYRLDTYKEVKDLKAQKEYYQEQIESDNKLIEKLTTDTAALEKFAREKYLMKKDDEDIFLIMKDDKKKK